MPERVQVVGIDELRAAIRKLGNIEHTREFKLAGYRAGDEVVIPAAKALAAHSRLQARAADTLVASISATGGAVRFGGGFAGAMGAEFGAQRNQRRNTSRGLMIGWNQFQPWRGSGGDAGYFLWPAIRAETDRIVEVIDDALDPLFRIAFPDRYGVLGALSHIGR